jgi:hypothetical protein
MKIEITKLEAIITQGASTQDFKFIDQIINFIN